MSADLTVSDETGHVVGLVQGRLQMAAFASTSLVVGPVADQPTVTGLDFSLAPCQHRPTIRLVPLGRSVLISLDTGPREPGGCDAMAVPYGVHIRSDQPLPMTDLVAHDQNEGTNSWGLLAPTIGDNRGIKVVDETGHVVAVSANPALGAEQGAAGISVDRGGRPDQIVVSWVADPCETTAELRLATVPSAVSMTLDLAPLDPATCNGGQMRFSITLAFDVAVSPDAFQVSVDHVR
ncbi:MAG TPA: hypothetical protein VJ398_10685 [Acidimicrobiia bacterium]|nr:hypothetical protein [Acidimicrobiia bacterium]